MDRKVIYDSSGQLAQTVYAELREANPWLPEPERVAGHFNVDFNLLEPTILNLGLLIEVPDSWFVKPMQSHPEVHDEEV